MNTLKSRLLATVVLTGVAVAASPSLAQVTTPEAAAVEEGQAPGDIVVTGSRIQRPDLTSASPISVVSQEEFRLSGAVNVEQVLNTLPQVLPGVTGFSNNPGNGAVTLNLRNLGATRTLVLVNGRRWMFYDTTQVVDLNTIPQFMLANVELLTGGASAVYGSDAIAGVVNFKLRTDLQGIEAAATYSITERGDGARQSFDIAMGSNFADNRGNVTVFGNYTRRDPIFQGARDFSRTAAGDGCIVPGSTNSRTSIGTPFTGPGGALVNATIGGVSVACGTGARSGGAVGFVPQGSATGPIATFPTLNRIFNPTGGGTRTFQDPGDLYNFAPDNYLQLPQERYLFGGFANYEVADNVELYTELSYINSVVPQELAPTPVGVTANLQIASPFFNEDTRAILRGIDAADATPNNGYATLSTSYRFVSAGARNQEATRQAFRILGGVRGNLADNVRYDLFYSYARTANEQFQRGNVSRSRLLNALNTSFTSGGALQCADAAARAAGCLPLNIFGQGLADPAAVRYVTINSTNLERSELKNVVGSVSGSLFNLGLGADDIGFAFGGEYRSMRSRYTPDTFLASGDVLGFNAGQPTSGGYNVKEVFGEVSVPIIREGFIHSLELTGAARYSDYSLPVVGGTWTYTGGGTFAPVRDITFRGQYSRAVRAPNVQNLFGGASTGFPQATDPCSDRGSAASRTDALRDFCIATGVPAANVFQRIVQPNTQIQADFGGNPNVGEETSDTYTAGVVLTPSFVPRLNIMVDYFNIKVENVIGVLGGSLAGALDLCYNTFRDVNNPNCAAIVGRRSAAGALGQTVGGQNPLILSANVGRLRTSGIDTQVDYNVPFFNGRLQFFYLGTWLDKYRNTPVAAIPEVEIIGEGTFGLPKYRHTSRITYQEDGAQLSLRWRFEGKAENSAVKNIFSGLTRVGTDPALLGRARVDAISYFDLTGSFDVTDGLTFTFGVNNLLDQKPPVLGSAAEQANTLPSYYDVLGRDFFVSARIRL